MSVKKKAQIAEDVFVAEGAVVRGNVTIKSRSSVWFHAVIRAETESVVIGEETNIQDNCVLHAGSEAAIRIGSRVTIGHGAIVHGCTVGDNTLIGMGAIILNHAVIGKNCLIGAGTLVTQHTVIPDNSLVIGNPGRVKRSLTAEEVESLAESAADYVREAQAYRDGEFA